MTDTIVGVDDGHAHTKIVVRYQDGRWSSHGLRSSVRSGRFGLSSLDGSRSTATYATAEGEDFTISDRIPPDATDFDSFHTSLMDRVLVRHAVLTVEAEPETATVVAGLPIREYFAGNQRNDARIAAKTANLLAPLFDAERRPVPAPGTVRIACQGIAAFMDWLLDENGVPRREPPASCAVIDIGGRTTDIAVVLNGETVDTARTGTVLSGALDVLEGLAERVRAAFGIQDRFPASVLEAALCSGKIRIWGKDEDVSSLVRQACADHEGRLLRELERRLGQAADIETVLFAGGGARVFARAAQAFRHGRTLDDPQFANARGFVKHELMRRRIGP